MTSQSQSPSRRTGLAVGVLVGSAVVLGGLTLELRSANASLGQLVSVFASSPGLWMLGLAPMWGGLLGDLLQEVTATRDVLRSVHTQLRVQSDNARVLSGVVGASTDGILLLSADGTIAQANGTAGRLFGREVDALLGARLLDLLPSYSKISDSSRAPRQTSNGVFLGHEHPIRVPGHLGREPIDLFIRQTDVPGDATGRSVVVLRVPDAAPKRRRETNPERIGRLLNQLDYPDIFEPDSLTSDDATTSIRAVFDSINTRCSTLAAEFGCQLVVEVTTDAILFLPQQALELALFRLVAGTLALSPGEVLRVRVFSDGPRVGLEFSMRSQSFLPKLFTPSTGALRADGPPLLDLLLALDARVETSVAAGAMTLWFSARRDQ